MDRLRRWESRTEWPLAVTALAFLVAYAWPILQPDLSAGAKRACHTVDYVSWSVFVIDYVVRLGVAPNRVRYFWRHIVDLFVVALPFLRPLRLLRFALLLRVLNRTAATSLRGRVAVYVAGASVLVIFCAALAALDAERGHPHANITTFGSALWWACVTVTTVGYGDHFPVTAEGRFVAIGLMLAGVALLGVVTASMATWFIEKVREVEDDAQAATRLDLAELRDEVRRLRIALTDENRSGERPRLSAAESGDP
jgi:voltage-gated potassium channel